jgi:hypothetical protein
MGSEELGRVEQQFCDTNSQTRAFAAIHDQSVSEAAFFSLKTAFWGRVLAFSPMTYAFFSFPIEEWCAFDHRFHHFEPENAGKPFPFFTVLPPR